MTVVVRLLVMVGMLMLVPVGLGLVEPAAPGGGEPAAGGGLQRLRRLWYLGAVPGAVSLWLGRGVVAAGLAGCHARRRLPGRGPAARAGQLGEATP